MTKEDECRATSKLRRDAERPLRDVGRLGRAQIADALCVEPRRGGAMYARSSRGEAHSGDLVSTSASSGWSRARLDHSRPRRRGSWRRRARRLLVVEEEERPLRQWDYFHRPADTRHVIVGAGAGPCAILMGRLAARGQGAASPGQRGGGEMVRQLRRRPRRRRRPTPTCR